MKGKRIRTLAGLMQAVRRKKAVSCSFYKKIPAAFVINYQGRLLYRLLKDGIYIYEKNNPDVG